MNQPLDEALRQTLQACAAPADLREGLLAQARRLDRRGPSRWPRLVVRMGLAAAMVLVLGSGLAWLKGRTMPGGGALAQAALADYLEPHRLSFQGTPPCPAGMDACCCWSRERLGFEAALPRSCATMAMNGGRACRLKGVAAACYCLEGGSTVYVFARPIPGAAPTQGKPFAVAANFQASAWNEGGRGYVMVLPR